MNKKILVFGNGWLGNKLKDYLGAELSPADITEKRAVAGALEAQHPDVVINAAGKTGNPNIDWCEDHQLETLASNATGPLVLLNECMNRNVRLVHISSGCIFTGASLHSGGFTEEDAPNPISFYSWTKAQADEALKR